MFARFIPTHVGNGQNRSARHESRPVHPHACGERQLVAVQAALLGGSSPRMWGTASAGIHLRRSGRFIPTHVGNGDRAYISDSWNRGSSPRMWGTGLAELGQMAVQRFIPTHVGNGQTCVRQHLPTPVHPHACGERHDSLLVLPVTGGSSPRMWGTGGKGRELRYKGTVHPHACGERQMRCGGSASSSGSSPRMWGTGDVLGFGG